MIKDSHKLFITRLIKSDNGVWLAARWLRQRGFLVIAEPFTIAPTRDDWMQHSDSGDLYIKRDGKVGAELLDGLIRMEVKHLTCDFTSLADWPFNDYYIVNSKLSHDRADPKPDGYIAMNDAGSHCGIVDTKTSEDWFVQKRYVKDFDATWDFYFTPMEHVTFLPMTILKG